MSLRPWKIAILMALLYALAGCSGAADNGTSSTSSPSTSGQSSPPTSENVIQEEPRPMSASCNLMVSVVNVPPAPAVNSGANTCSFSILGLDLSNATMASARVTWDSLQPSIAAVTLYLFSQSCQQSCSLAETQSSSSPLVLEIPSQVLVDNGSDGLFVSVFPEGLSYQQPFNVTLSALLAA
jgi:hypothetical protein